ncbi:MAG: hypothetical protein KIT80_02435 [Chitinophagaceae bacterium]|nr:hypothetical protein [Chitinophagaceae bacterium]MCW5925743.1 hypothetical protein [Chitinophagaceae bacterium]
MKKKRRQFLKITGLAGLGLASGSLPSITSAFNSPDMPTQNLNEATSMIGLYGPWATSLYNNNLPGLSFLNKHWSRANQQEWKKKATEKVLELMAAPEIKASPQVQVKKQYVYDGLQVEEMSWQLPYGRPTDAIVLKPATAKGKLPGILAFHDHGGNKYLGTRKITRTGDSPHPMVVTHQEHYYDGMAWANEVAKRGYVVMISDAFPFASRRVLLQDVPERIRKGLNDNDPENQDNIDAYNEWAAEHEHIMAKSLFSAGITWPGVFWAEDKKALDILCARPDVDASRIGCGGLSGGGMRTVFMGGLDHRIQCAVCVGFMTTWRDFALSKSFTHTWMTYVPGLAPHLDFPEILGLRVPLPTLVLNDNEDALYTLEEMKNADDILKSIYKKAGMPERYKCSFYPGPHKFDKPMQEEAFAWFDRWLKK